MAESGTAANQEAPPSYGSVTVSDANAPPQPGPLYAADGYPQEPPPKYEPPKDQDYPVRNQPGVYPPQNAGYQQHQVHQTVYVTDVRWGPAPQLLQCPHCYAQVTTHTTFKPGALTWLSGGLICLFGTAQVFLCDTRIAINWTIFGFSLKYSFKVFRDTLPFWCWAGCCLIPLCIPDLLDVEHRCPNCGTYLGMHTRI